MSNKANFICLDTGDTKIVVIAANILFENKYEILHHSIYPSEGFKRSEIVNFSKVQKHIEYIINATEKALGETIDIISIVFSGSDIGCHYIVHERRMDGGVITKIDIKNLAVAAMHALKQQTSRALLHCFPIDFHVDEYKELQNPIGMAGYNFSSNFHIISANPSILQAISDCFAKCNVNVEEFLIASVLEGIEYSRSDAQSTDMLVIDFGYLSTTFTILSENVPLFSDAIKIGGHHVTSDLAHVLSINSMMAEKIKILFCDIDKVDSVTIDLNQIQNNDEESSLTNHTIETRLMNDVVRARLKEILILIKTKMKQKNRDILRVVAKKIVITGRGSNIKGLKALCANIFDVDEVKDAAEYLGQRYKEHNFEDDKIYAAALAALEYRSKNYLNYYANPSEEKVGLLKRFFDFLKNF